MKKKYSKEVSLEERNTLWEIYTTLKSFYPNLPKKSFEQFVKEIVGSNVLNID